MAGPRQETVYSAWFGKNTLTKGPNGRYGVFSVISPENPRATLCRHNAFLRLSRGRDSPVAGGSGPSSGCSLARVAPGFSGHRKTGLTPWSIHRALGSRETDRLGTYYACIP